MPRSNPFQRAHVARSMAWPVVEAVFLRCARAQTHVPGGMNFRSVLQAIRATFHECSCQPSAATGTESGGKQSRTFLGTFPRHSWRGLSLLKRRNTSLYRACTAGRYRCRGRCDRVAYTSTFGKGFQIYDQAFPHIFRLWGKIYVMRLLHTQYPLPRCIVASMLLLPLCSVALVLWAIVAHSCAHHRSTPVSFASACPARAQSCLSVLEAPLVVTHLRCRGGRVGGGTGDVGDEPTGPIVFLDKRHFPRERYALSYLAGMCGKTGVARTPGMSRAGSNTERSPPRRAAGNSRVGLVILLAVEAAVVRAGSCVLHFSPAQPRELAGFYRAGKSACAQPTPPVDAREKPRHHRPTL